VSSSDAQHWNPAQYAEHARFVSDLGLPVIELLAPQPGESILDLGCGDGALTIKLVELGCHVVGVDSSTDMIAAARSLGLNVQVIDGQALPFTNEFDAVFSNAALHWMTHPEPVITGVWRALKPGGRFVGEFGGYGNVTAIITAIEAALSSRGLLVPHPWFFPHPEEYTRLLMSRGFSVESMALMPRLTSLPGDMGDWLETFAQPYTSVLSVTEKQGCMSEIVDTLRPVLSDAQGRWYADYVRLRFSATKPYITPVDTMTI
jgi:trans-aconitate methyltransferase